jgi:hypothetical protein
VFCSGRADEESESIKALTAQRETLDTWIQRQAKIRGAITPVRPWNVNTDAQQVPVRTSPFGPVDNQNDDALLARLGRDRFNGIKLIHGDTPQAGLYAYEILNFVDGKRTVGEIRDMVSAEFGPIAIDLVTDYLRSLTEAKIIELKPPQPK